MKRNIITFILAALVLVGTPLDPAQQAQPQPQVPSLTVEKIRGEVYFVKGGAGANTGFAVTDQGVLAVDAKMTAEAAKQELAEIAKLTSKPVAVMVLTHSDGDHVNGLTGFPAGMVIQAHAQTKKDMEAAFQDPKMEGLRAYLPTLTFDESGTVTLGSLKVELLHFGPAHTSGDVVVFFPKDKVAFVGDLVFIGRDPLIHLRKGGTSFGLVKTLKALLRLDADIFLPGHGEALGKPQIEVLLKSVEDRQARIQDMVGQGKSLEEVKKAFNISEDTAPGGRRWPSLVEIIYQELTAKK